MNFIKKLFEKTKYRIVSKEELELGLLVIESRREQDRLFALVKAKEKELINIIKLVDEVEVWYKELKIILENQKRTINRLKRERDAKYDMKVWGLYKHKFVANLHDLIAELEKENKKMCSNKKKVGNENLANSRYRFARSYMRMPK